MISFLHDAPARPSGQGEPYVEALARLASLKEAVAQAQPAGIDMGDVSKSWPMASREERAAFQGRAAAMTKAAAIGLDALADIREAGASADGEKLAALADALQGGIDDLDQLLTL